MLATLIAGAKSIAHFKNMKAVEEAGVHGSRSALCSWLKMPPI
jgi:hypothetical protein